MSHGRYDLGQQVISGVDLVIDFATLGEYGLESAGSGRRAVGRFRERPGQRPRAGRRPGWEASATARRGACATSRREAPIEWRVPGSDSRRADFRSAVEHYTA
jgi:hypothetical protein